ASGCSHVIRRRPPMEGRSCLGERMIVCFGSIASTNAHVRKLAMKKLLLTSAIVLFLATGAAHAAEDTRKWVWRCSIPHAPGSEQLEEQERCCKRWPNVPNRNGDYARAMSLSRCAKLPFVANMKCAERILEEKKKNARSH